MKKIFLLLFTILIYINTNAAWRLHLTNAIESSNNKGVLEVELPDAFVVDESCTFSITCPKDTFYCFDPKLSFTLNPIEAKTLTGTCNLTYSYTVTGKTSRTGGGTDASGTFNVGESTVTWSVSNNDGTPLTCSTKVIVNSQITASITSDPKPPGATQNTVYLGVVGVLDIRYSQKTLTANATGGTGGPFYSYKWSTGATSQAINVQPTTGQTYTVTVTDAKKCTQTAQIYIDVIDLRCSTKKEKKEKEGKKDKEEKLDGIRVCINGVEECRVPNNVKNQLVPNGTWTLPPCGGGNRQSLDIIGSPELSNLHLSSIQNPVNSQFTLKIASLGSAEKVNIKVMDVLGRSIEQKIIPANQTFNIGKNYSAGFYFIQASQGKEKVTLKLRKL